MAAADSLSPENLASKSVQKRYDGLVTVRTKAIKGKGAWYWSHLEPLLVHSADTSLPKAVKLRCSLCDAVFSASNPSRTASEHLKRRNCPNFNSSAATPISSFPPPPHNHRKRGSPATHLKLSGGRDDLGALARLEESVKKLKSPKTSPGPTLRKTQIDFAFDCLADWVYESCGSVSLSSLEHPKFKSFLRQIGLPAISRREIAGHRLDNKYEEAMAESESRIRDAMFFQIASNGWKSKNHGGGLGEGNLVNLTVNLPNGTSVYRRALFVSGSVPSNFAEEVLLETVSDICGNALEKCVGVVSDRFQSNALKNLENLNPWMVNISCQLQGFNALVTDFTNHLPLFKTVTSHCHRLANFVNNSTELCSALGFPIRELTLLEDIHNSARTLQAIISDSPSVGEGEEIVRDPGFWSDLEAARSLLNLVKEMIREIEFERPLIGQCLPLWEDLKRRVKYWCSDHGIPEEPVKKLIDRRFQKNYHPAWAAAFILDPLYLTKDTSGRYLPPFQCLTPDQEKDVDKLVTRLVSREEAHIALMELMKWRTEGLDPVYARAVQMREMDPISGKMRITNRKSGRLVWETYLTEFKTLGKVAARLIFLHATSGGYKCDWSFVRSGKARALEDRAEKLVFLAAHSKLQRRGEYVEEDKDVHFFGNGDDDNLIVKSSA